MTAPDAGYTPDPAAEYAKLAEASKSPEDFWLVYRTLMASYDSSCRVAHMTTFADEVAALAVSALAAEGRLLPADAETRTEWGFARWEGDVVWQTTEYAARIAAAEHPPAVAMSRAVWVGPWLPAPTSHHS